MKKKSHAQSRRLTLRYPKVAEAFSRRFRQAIAEVGCSQRDLAEKLGGFRNDTISRLCRGQATAVPLDLFVRITEWADTSGISLRWLLLGFGSMQKGDIDQPPQALEQINQAAVIRLIAAFAARAGIDLTDIMAGIQIAAWSPEWGLITGPATEAIGHKKAKKKKVKTAPPEKDKWKIHLFEPGFHEVDRGEVPALWRDRYLPVIGRLSAGEGVDTAEAEAHPPGWADSFIEYNGGPPGAFALRVVGDSMTPEFIDGDMVIVDPARTVTSGVACVILVEDGERRARLKKLERKGRRAHLVSLNAEKHPPVTVQPKKLIAAYGIIAHLPRVVEKSDVE